MASGAESMIPDSNPHCYSLNFHCDVCKEDKPMMVKLATPLADKDEEAELASMFRAIHYKKVHEFWPPDLKDDEA